MTSQSVALAEAQAKVKRAFDLFLVTTDYYDCESDQALDALVEWARAQGEVDRLTREMQEGENR